MKWYRNKDMLKSILEDNKKELIKPKETKYYYLLKDETILIKDHLELMAENQELKDKGKEMLHCFKKAIEVAKKYKKAIEILKDKDVDINLLISSNCLEDYNYQYSVPLTQQEYELLKEVLGNE